MTSADQLARRLWSLLDMLRFYAEKFLKAHHLMSQLEIASNEFRSGKVQSVDPDAVVYILQYIDNMLPLLADMDLTLSLRAASELRSHFDKHRSPAALGLSGDLARRLHDEIEMRYFLSLSPTERTFYEHAIFPFGESVSTRFPKTSVDITEAFKCFGLGRYTATVFHLMRAMEVAVVALGTKLGVTVIDKDKVHIEWGKIIANLSVPVEKMPRGNEKDKWASTLVLLTHVKMRGVILLCILSRHIQRTRRKILSPQQNPLCFLWPLCFEERNSVKCAVQCSWRLIAANLPSGFA